MDEIALMGKLRGNGQKDTSILAITARLLCMANARLKRPNTTQSAGGGGKPWDLASFTACTFPVDRPSGEEVNPWYKAGTAAIAPPAPQVGPRFALLPRCRSGTAGCAPVGVKWG